MKIQHTTIYVSDQAKALRFYTEVLGFQVKADFSNGGFRWLTVVPADDPEGCQLQLAADIPAGKAYREALAAAKQPAIMFTTKDLAGDFERAKSRGAEVAMPPTDVTASKIAQLSDGCGNLIQLTQLNW